MKKLTNIILFLWVVLCVSDWAVTFGYTHYLIVGRAIRFMVILLSLSIIFFWGRVKPNKFPFTSILITIAGICFFYIFTGVYLDESAYEYSKLLLWVSEALALYILARNGKLTCELFEKTYSYVAWIATGATILYAVVLPDMFSEEYNASAYLLTFALPGLFLDSNRMTKKWLTKAVALLGIFITLKKGALLCAGTGLTAYICLYNIHHFTYKKLVYSAFTLLFGGVVTIVVLFTQADRIEERFSTKGLNRSVGGREGMYLFLYKRWQNADKFTYIFGYGDRAETWLAGPNRRTVAHSDIYGRLHNNGLVGGLMIFLLHLGFFLCYWKLRQTPYAYSTIMAWIIFMGASVFSGTFYEPNSAFLYNSIAVGCGIYDWGKENLVNTNNLRARVAG